MRLSRDERKAVFELVSEQAERFGVPAHLVLGRARDRLSCAARAETMSCLRACGWGLEKIGRAFERDRSTVSHSLRSL